MLTAARITLKHRRFELATVTIAALAIGVAALWLTSQLLAVQVPTGCLEDWVASAGSPSASCGPKAQLFLRILNENLAWIDPALLLLPFAGGALLGAPLVARELEARTAQTAWSLSASRTRWLLRQMWPVAIVAGAAITFAAAAGSIVHDTAGPFAGSTFGYLGYEGPLLVARAVAVFSIGLLTGAVLGRVLNALIVTAVLCALLIFFFSVGARNAWIASLPTEVISEEDLNAGRAAIVLDQRYRSPGGDLISADQAFSQIPPDVVFQDEWLADNGYQRVALGISASTASRWEPIELTGTTLLAASLLALSVPIVNYRRAS